ncbi:MAG: glycosyltransferase, partial [Proteobacteria bacterium]|nr:glycosyltransferase [Pseudomonadota bacterium]
TLGIIGEYLGRTYMEVKGRPLYLIRERHGFGPEELLNAVDSMGRRHA